MNLIRYHYYFSIFLSIYLFNLAHWRSSTNHTITNFLLFWSLACHLLTCPVYLLTLFLLFLLIFTYISYGWDWSNVQVQHWILIFVIIVIFDVNAIVWYCRFCFQFLWSMDGYILLWALFREWYRSRGPGRMRIILWGRVRRLIGHGRSCVCLSRNGLSLVRTSKFCTFK